MVKDKLNILSNFFLRAISTVTLIPLVVMICYWGGFWYNIFIVSIAILMAFEWNQMTDSYEQDSSKGKILYWFWKLFGISYIALPTVSLIYIRSDIEGFKVIIWMFSVIWATDIFAYLGGRLIKGPKLIPFISPNKTWSGLISGVLAGSTIGLSIVHMLHGNVNHLLAITIIVSIYSQIGDLLESFIKRLCNTKDSGNLILGHGGILDRVDSIVLVAPKIAALVGIFHHKLF